MVSGEPLPDFNLQRGEVERVGLFPVYGTGGMDIYEGCYLSEEKVAIKMMRSVVASPKSLEVSVAFFHEHEFTHRSGFYERSRSGL